jgi:ribosomal protein S25
MGSRVARSKLNSGVAQIALQALQQRGAFMSPSSDDSNAVSKIGRINILRI